MSPRKPDHPTDDEVSSFGGRLKRYTQVSSAVGGLAAKMAGERVFGIKSDDAARAIALKAALGGLKGPLMKVAQILSTLPDFLPEDYSRELAELQANAPEMGWPFVKRRMAGELGPDWLARFDRFDHQAAAAASLGQVHRARARDGRELACKLQYPDMASVVEADLRQLKLLLTLYRSYDSAIDPSNVYGELSERLAEELDYQREAANMRLYATMLAGEASVHVPEPLADLSSQRLLTMTWLAGRPLAEFEEAPQEARNRIAAAMFRAWYVPFYNFGVIHGDPHPGNYSVRPDLGINLLDFGCVRIFSPRFVAGVIDLYRALITDDRDLAVHAYESWGFSSLSNELVEVLNLWARFIYGPLLDDRTRSIQGAEGGRFGRTVAEKVHAELRRVGGVKPPREFVLVDRAAVGLGAVFIRLKAEINWHDLFQGLIENFDPEALGARQTAALATSGLAT